LILQKPRQIIIAPILIDLRFKKDFKIYKSEDRGSHKSLSHPQGTILDLIKLT
jgi:hypothetical protein